MGTSTAVSAPATMESILSWLRRMEARLYAAEHRLSMVQPPPWSEPDPPYGTPYSWPSQQQFNPQQQFQQQFNQQQPPLRFQQPSGYPYPLPAQDYATPESCYSSSPPTPPQYVSPTLPPSYVLPPRDSHCPSYEPPPPQHYPPPPDPFQWSQPPHASDHVYPDLAMKEVCIIRDADDVMEPQISLDCPSSSGNHNPKGTGKKESIGLNDGKDVEMILSDASNHDANEKIWDVNCKEADVVETQTEQTLEDVSVINKMMTEKTICSAGDCRAETENTIVESNQTDKDNKNTESRHTKSKKKTKRRRATTDIQENLPDEDQKVGSELLGTKQTSIFANSELDGRYVDSTEVLSRKSEKKVDEKHELVLNTDGHAEISGKTDKGINFKSYFVADQLQNKVDSSDKVRKTTRSTRSSTKAESNDLPSVNIPIEVENSVKSLENKKPENNSYREDIVRTMYDSVHNSDGDEMSPNSLKISSKTTEKEVKDSSPELGAVTSEKHDDIVTGSSLQKKIPSLDNSSSERSQTLHNNVGNEMPQLGQNATSMMPMKTPKKKISSAKSGAILHNNGGKERPMLAQNATNLLLIKTPKKKISLAKSGAIFEDNSGESSGDENGTMHSDAGTLSPSDSSSTLGDSAGESELSQSSVNNGCNDAKEKSPSKFDLSATEDLTMDVILRSSKRFKKAKQLASQNETEPIEFVPDSLPL